MSPIFRILAVLLLVLALPAAAVDEVFQTDDGAIRGYDPVAYHVENRPVKGRAEFSHEWNGARWRFASAANRDLFAADPARYAPQYGGYCAFGTSRGYKVSTDPAAFAVVDGKLYLNYNKPVQATWNRDRPGYIATADRNWVELAPTPYVEE
jgi:YHS domain-containing protein